MKKATVIIIIAFSGVMLAVSAVLFVFTLKYSIEFSNRYMERYSTEYKEYNEYKIIIKDDSEGAEAEVEPTEPCERAEHKKPTEQAEKNGECTCEHMREPQEFEMIFDEFEVKVIVEFDSSVGFSVDKTHGVIKGVPYGTTTYANFSFTANTEKAEYFSYKIYDENDLVIDRGTVFVGNGETQEICSLLPINRNTTYKVFVFGDE